MYPLKFKSALIKKIWGGRALEEVLKIKLPDNEKYGESWEVSSHPNGMTYVLNGEYEGTSLQDLLNKYKDELVGEEVYEKFGNKFPLLLKFLDINDKLSVQVHPDDKYALKNENEFGKGECWYVIDASEDAKLILGAKKDILKETFKTKVENKDFDDIFNIVNVKKGDLINIRPGLIHASLEGSILIYEPQQNSDVTYRIYDFDREVDGVKRELHLDKALEVIDFESSPDIIRDEDVASIIVGNAIIKPLIKETYFSLDKIFLNGKYEEKLNKSFKVISVLNGQGIMNFNDTKYELNVGDIFLIPANLTVELDGKLELLKVYL